MTSPPAAAYRAGVESPMAMSRAQRAMASDTKVGVSDFMLAIYHWTHRHLVISKPIVYSFEAI